ncbi:MAG: cytochrome c oxidase subunit 3 [Armatimonadota bacterium]
MAEIEKTSAGGGVIRGDIGDGEGEPNGNGHGDATEAANMARLLTWLGLVSLAMGLGSLAFVYVHQALDRLADRSFEPPGTLWVSTILIVVSSLTYVIARGRLRSGDGAGLVRWLAVTFALGLLFVVSQVMVWTGLVAQGVYAQTYPLSGMFYIMTIAHAVHVLGGLAWLGAVLAKAARGGYSTKRQLGVELCGVYWHFLDVVWLMYFVVLMVIR